MIDLHAHILPGIDDGSPSLDRSLSTITQMVQAGVTDVCATSHFIRGHYPTSRALLDEKTAELQAAIDENRLGVKVHPGAEVLIQGGSNNDIRTERLFLGKSDYVLVECEMNSMPPDLFDVMYDLVRSGIRPVLAHPERYLPVRRDFGILEDLLYRNVYFQVNAASLLGGYGRGAHEIAWRLLDQGLAQFVASDTHCRGDAYPLALAAEAIAREIDPETARLLTEVNPGKLLRNEEIDFVQIRFEHEKPRTFWQKIGDVLWNR